MRANRLLKAGEWFYFWIFQFSFSFIPKFFFLMSMDSTVNNQVNYV